MLNFEIELIGGVVTGARRNFGGEKPGRELLQIALHDVRLASFCIVALLHEEVVVSEFSFLV